MKVPFENNNLEDVLTHIRELYCIQTQYEPHIISKEELATPLSEITRTHIIKARELYHFIKTFVENKAGELPPKTMVIQHRILESMLNKCEFTEAARLNYIGLSYFMNVENRKKIEQNLESLPF